MTAVDAQVGGPAEPAVPAGGAVPAGWALRRPALADVPEILDLAGACSLATMGEPGWTAEEVTETLTAPNHDRQRDSWLVYDPDALLVAWAYLDNPAGKPADLVEIYARPGIGEPAQRPLLDLAIRRVVERARAWGYPEMTLRAGALPAEEAYVRVLLDAGFAFQHRHARMRRQLTGAERPPERPPDLPGGVVVRPLRADDEADRRGFFDILRTAFSDPADHVPAEYADWAAWIASLPTVSFDEWYVAEADGVPAGVLQSSDQFVEQHEAWVKNLAVLPAYRRRGIGRALLATAFATYAGKGRTAVGLGVNVTNPTGAYQLYTSVGMAPVFEADAYERTVTA